MKLKKAIRIGRDCGLKSVNECIRNIEIHSLNLFPSQKIDNELSELTLDIEKISKEYEVPENEILKWSIKEALMYV